MENKNRHICSRICPLITSHIVNYLRAIAKQEAKVTLNVTYGTENVTQASRATLQKLILSTLGAPQLSSKIQFSPIYLIN